MGTILPYVGDLDKIPKKWHLCDGTAGTPNLTGRFLEGTLSAPNRYIEAGLPNITGHLSLITGGTSGNGAFKNVWDQVVPVIVAGYGEKIITTDFDAESGRKYWHQQTYGTVPTDAIYGNSNTVQPKAYTVYYIIKIKN